jgi:hypothetical protein
MVDPERSFATPTDREFARSQVIATGMASPYYQRGNQGSKGAAQYDRDSARDVAGSSSRTVSTDDTRTDPEIIDDAAARARRRRGQARDPTERTDYKQRRRRQRRNRDRYYGSGDD